jgi:hypothetical protein
LKKTSNTTSTTVQIGGYQEYQKSLNEKYLESVIKRPFTGGMYGLVYNDVKYDIYLFT